MLEQYMNKKASDLPNTVRLAMLAYGIEYDKIEQPEFIHMYCANQDGVAVLEELEKQCWSGNGKSIVDDGQGLFDQSMEKLAFLSSARSW